MDLSSIPNPYDFANPVLNADLFAGREEELGEISYYLDYAKKVKKPINLAIMGQRASGKTSLLNMTHGEAQKRDFCVVRIDLDESDACSQLAFFYKLFDSILTSACEHGAFNGICGKTYQTYIQTSNSYEIPSDFTFCPFRFPNQYAYAMSRNNTDTQISDHNFRKDLQLIYQETKVPIIILFDESNVLTINRILLEKIRNIFMNIDGYMLILTGTPELFPIIDSIFSPLVRQFKKITLSAFKSRNETADCITNPLDKFGILYDDILSRNIVDEVHHLSGGRPYEIQLICHFLFKQVQQKQTKVMKLNFRALEGIRSELLRSADLQSRTIINAVKKLSDRDLRAVGSLCCCDGHAKFEELWGIESAFSGTTFWTQQSLRSLLDRLITLGIFSEDKQIIKFAGDEFDKLYIKYYANEKKIHLNFLDSPVEVYWQVRLASALSKLKGIYPFDSVYVCKDIIDIGEIARKMGDLESQEDIFADGPLLVKDLYILMNRFDDQEALPILSISVKFLFLQVHSWYYFEPGCSNNIECMELLEKIAGNVMSLGGELSYKVNIVSFSSRETLQRKVLFTTNEKLRIDLSNYHHHALFQSYVFEKNLEKAIFHADVAIKYNPDIKYVSYCTNLGYIYIAKGELEEAKKILLRALSSDEKNYEKALPLYNLGILSAIEKDYQKSVEYFSTCIDYMAELGNVPRFCSCLFTLKEEKGELLVEECVNDPELTICATRAFEIVSHILPKPGFLTGS